MRRGCHHRLLLLHAVSRHQLLVHSHRRRLVVRSGRRRLLLHSVLLCCRLLQRGQLLLQLRCLLCRHLLLQ